MYHDTTNELYHHGVKGMKWGVRRYQNKLIKRSNKRSRYYNDLAAETKTERENVRKYGRNSNKYRQYVRDTISEKYEDAPGGFETAARKLADTHRMYTSQQEFDMYVKDLDDTYRSQVQAGKKYANASVQLRNMKGNRQTTKADVRAIYKKYKG